MLKLKLQFFSHLMWRTDSLEKTMMLGKIEGGRRRGQQRIDGWMASPTQWTWVWVSSGSWWWTGKPLVLQSIGSQRVGHSWATKWTSRFFIAFDMHFNKITLVHGHRMDCFCANWMNYVNREVVWEGITITLVRNGSRLCKPALAHHCQKLIVVQITLMSQFLKESY